MDANQHKMSLFGRILTVCVLSTTAWSGSILAQQTRTITFTEAIGIALEQNLNLKQSANRVELSETAVRRKRADFYPDLTLSIEPEQRYGRAFDETVGRVEDDRRETLELTASSDITLFDGFGNVASYRAAGFDLDVRRENLEHTRQRIIFKTAARFLQVGLGRERVRIEEENLEAQRQQFRRIESLWEKGVRARIDVLQQREDVARAELRLLNAKQKHGASKLRLKQILRLDPLANIRFVAPVSVAAKEPIQYEP